MTTTSTTDQDTADRTGAPTRLAVIVGSIRADRFGPTPANWIADHARKRDALQVDVVDLADYDLPVVLGGNDPDAPPPAPVAALGERLASADAFVVVTPVYNRAYPASLKNAIDWFYDEWQLKPVGFVSYGGITGGLQSIDALRGVFTEFHSVPLRDSIMFANFWEVFDHDGRPVNAERTAELARGFLDQLTWWAQALRDARTGRPYPFAASE
ncbi:MULTISPECIES: NADPH-dependent FMN reductase [Prauserella salsuginis group]|uniref:NAD(P)H-dependent FMN reductase n=2 Tax=Prauserella salsuginis group TaxID=2893672 RepID=A0A839XKB5_9PSEU|nr:MULTISPECIES: NAD(P)H-dependent oxidoreductase [Prauserella salsuginis group]MBB3663730.1 NAD(P)H-dependent FMN reductase [Prauserella sediminis]MCR3722490.1 NAD(P)H-dependent FMN reductase [Prauserella flava]MCR3736932.1 NAD(P)H-dependent FMN reductase [Prauserella salsuginis]